MKKFIAVSSVVAIAMSALPVLASTEISQKTTNVGTLVVNEAVAGSTSGSLTANGGNGGTGGASGGARSWDHSSAMSGMGGNGGNGGNGGASSSGTAEAGLIIENAVNTTDNGADPCACDSEQREEKVIKQRTTNALTGVLNGGAAVADSSGASTDGGAGGSGGSSGKAKAAKESESTSGAGGMGGVGGNGGASTTGAAVSAGAIVNIVNWTINRVPSSI